VEPVAASPVAYQSVPSMTSRSPLADAGSPSLIGSQLPLPVFDRMTPPTEPASNTYPVPGSTATAGGRPLT
jgi:hypothetical protein